jgi:hypothetical protein
MISAVSGAPQSARQERAIVSSRERLAQPQKTLYQRDLPENLAESEF